MKRFDRFKLLIGDNNYNLIKNKTVLIVGIGGVGGYTLESLARSGINNFIIIDNDIIDETNINRQIIALEDNIGLSKVEIAKNRVLNINSEANISAIQEFLTKDNINILNKYNIDYIVDACDTIDTKIELIKYSIDKNIKIISSMGMGKRLNAQDISISRLDKTQNDPLAKIIRQKLRKENVSLKIPVVYSKEIPQKIDANCIASCSYIPAIAGLYITNYIINDIIDV